MEMCLSAAELELALPASGCCSEPLGTSEQTVVSNPVPREFFSLLLTPESHEVCSCEGLKSPEDFLFAQPLKPFRPARLSVVLTATHSNQVPV